MSELEASDLAGSCELVVEIKCRRCKQRTTLTFSHHEPEDDCGYCGERYHYQLSYLRLFGETVEYI